MGSVRRLSTLATVAVLVFSSALRADLNSLTLPKAFQKPVPENVKDLLEIQQHVKKLVDKITQCTVGLRIGGSSGSGVIINKEGYVLTAGHVSGKPDQEVQIILQDGKIIKGKTLGANRGIDSGMLKITDKGNWPFVEMAKGEIKKGDWCIAMGHHDGSQKGRTPPFRLGRVLEVSKDKGYVRTSCKLVGGDSGGPLFDMHGNVIGIHSRIGPSIDANIHVPISTYEETWDKLVAAEVWGETLFGGKKGGGPKKGGDAYLGVRPDPTAKELKIQMIAPDSPAAKAGLRVDDIIVSIDGKKLGSNDEFDKLMLARQPGNLLALEVRRGDAMLNMKVTLGKRPG